MGGLFTCKAFWLVLKLEIPWVALFWKTQHDFERDFLEIYIT